MVFKECFSATQNPSMLAYCVLKQVTKDTNPSLRKAVNIQACKFGDIVSIMWMLFTALKPYFKGKIKANKLEIKPTLFLKFTAAPGQI